MPNHSIPLSQAVAMTKLYRSHRDNILKPEYQGQNLLLTCETFDRAAFDTLLAEPGCEKIRIYFSMNEKLQVVAIVVGVNAAGEDLLPTETGDGNDYEIIEDGLPCPSWCPPPSPLNEG